MDAHNTFPLSHMNTWGGTHLHIPAHTGTPCILTLILYTYIFTLVHTYALVNMYKCMQPIHMYTPKTN